MRTLRYLLRSFGYAFEGVWYTLFTQRNARIEVCFGLAAIVVAAWLGLSEIAWTILLLTIGSVLAVETMNTAIERMVDLLSPEKQQNAKHAKDAAAGAVLVLSITAAVIGLVILGPHLYRRLWP